MRKIDAVLLSALIVYDYSAQSLVDNDTISLGRSFTNNSINEHKLADKDYSFIPNFSDMDSYIRGAQKVNQDDIDAVMDTQTISFHELAKVNPATEIIASRSLGEENAEISISIPMPAEEAMEIVAPERYSTTTEYVEVNSSNYSTDIINTDKISEEVAAAADMSTFDSDADGTVDVEDKCPGVVGVARFEGCPVPDSDADGVNDEEDRCPFEKGNADSYGCPIIVNETIVAEPSSDDNIVEEKNNQFNFTVYFNKDNKILSSEDFNIVLQLTDILVRTPNATVEIESVANANPDLPQTPDNLLYTYFKDLGVSQNQIIINKQSKEAKQIVTDGKSKVEMRIKL